MHYGCLGDNYNMDENKSPMIIDNQKFVVTNEHGLQMKVISKIWNRIQFMWFLTLIVVLIIHFW